MTLIEAALAAALAISMLTNLSLVYVILSISRTSAYERATHSTQMLTAAQAMARGRMSDFRRKPGTPRGEPPVSDREEAEAAKQHADKPHPRDPDHPDRAFFQ